MARIVEAVEEGPVSVPPLNHVPAHQARRALLRRPRHRRAARRARAIVTFTQSGDTARRLARLHTRLPLLAFTPMPEVRSQLAMSWGVETFLVDFVESTDAMVRQVDHAMLSIERFQPGDLVVVVAGSPPGTAGSDQPHPGAPPGRGGLRPAQQGCGRRGGGWRSRRSLSRMHGVSTSAPTDTAADGQPHGQVVLDGLVKLLDLEQLELNLFRGISPPHSPTRVFGGQVAGQALVAAGRDRSR